MPPIDLKPGDQVWVRGTVRENWPGEAYVRLEFECPRMTQSVCVGSADVFVEPVVKERANGL